MVQVSCGSGDAHTVAVDESGGVWSWGDGDYGKLGRGGSEAAKVPKPVTQWGVQGVKISKVVCGGQFTIALTRDGKIYTW